MKKISNFFLFLIFAFGLILSLFPQTNISAETKNKYFWKIAAVKGKTFYKTNENSSWVPCKIGLILYEGYQLKTEKNSSIYIVIYENNKKDFTKIFENTTIKISKKYTPQGKPQDILLDLLEGELLVSVENMPKKSSFKVKTPTAITGVKGTKFGVKVFPDQTTQVYVLKGVVYFSNTGLGTSPKTIELSAGQRSSVRPQAPPMPPEPIPENLQQQYEALTNSIEKSLDSFDMNAPIKEEKFKDMQPRDGDEIVTPDGKKYIYDSEKGGWVDSNGKVISDAQMREIAPPMDFGEGPQPGEVLIGPDGKRYIFDPGKGGWVGPDGSVVQPGVGFVPEGTEPPPGFINPKTGEFIPFIDPNHDPNFEPPKWYEPMFYDADFNPFKDVNPFIIPPPPDYTGNFNVWIGRGDVPDNLDYPIEFELTCHHELDYRSDCTYEWSVSGATGVYINGNGPEATLVITKDVSNDIFYIKCVVTTSDGLQGYGTIKFNMNEIPVYYYVSPSTGSDSNPGTSEKPFATIQKALNEAEDTFAQLVVIWLEPTTYNINSTLNIPEEISIRTWEDYGPGTAILDGGGANIILLDYDGIHDNTHFNPQNLILQNAAIGIKIENAHLLGNKLTVKNMTNVGVKVVYNEDFPGDIEISQSTFENFASGTCIEYGKPGEEIDNAYLKIWGCTFQNNTTTNPIVSICASHSNLEFRKNNFVTNENSSTLILRRGSSSLSEIRQCSFRNNGTISAIGNILSFDCPSPAELNFLQNTIKDNNTSSSLIDIVNVEDIEISNNLITGNTTGGVSNLIDSNALGETIFVFNTLDDNISGSGTLLNLISSDGIILCANAFTEGSPTSTALTHTGSLDDEFNYLYNVANGDITDGVRGNFRDTQDRNSLYYDITNGDYHLKVGSVLIDAAGSENETDYDIEGNGRPIDGDGNNTALNDIGCYEKQDPTDPIISGTVYDSVTNQPVNGATIAIYKKDTTSPTSTNYGATYSFNVDPGWYYLVVNKEGYYFPSTRKAAETTGDHGENFLVKAGINQQINIPIDSSPFLSITKTANKTKAVKGEIITFNIKIENPYWFSSVTNVKLYDKKIPGLKFIKGSVQKDGSKCSDPATEGNNYVFDIGTIGSSQTINISYQVAVSTGIAYGRYGSEAVCKHSITKEQMSNKSLASILITPDPMFDFGTIIGRVFIDENNNRKYDKNEKGVKNAIIYTEYGLKIKTDENGRFHIQSVLEGRHLLKLDPSSLPDGYKPFDSHGKLIFMEKGALKKANIPVVKTDKKEENKFFIVALGETTLRYNNFSGNIEMVEKDDDFDENFSISGRGAFYLKGKIKGKYLIEASFDSERRSEKQKFITNYKFFRNLDPDKYYPVYGDASSRDYSATETGGLFYVLIKWDESFAKWGNIEIDLPSYRRVTHGAQIVYKSLKENKFGNKNLEIKGFYGISNHQSSHEEFIGTGTSIYELGHENIIEGSEKVEVQIKDRITKLPIYSRTLQEEIDYQIDYDAGRIILTRPLSTSYWNYSHSIINQDVTTGAQPTLVVDYEYETYELLKRDSFGGRIDKTIGNHIKIGIQGIQEERDQKDYKLYGADATINFTKKTNISASYYDSRESFQGGGVSYDGGITITSQDPDFKEGQKGTYYTISGNSKILSDKLLLSASYSKTDPGYSALGSLTTQGTEQYIGSAVYEINKNTKAGIRHITIENLEENEITKVVNVSSRSHTTNIFAETKKEKIDGRIEYQYQETGTIYSVTKYPGNLPQRGKQIAAGRIGYQYNENIKTYAIAQSTIEGPANDQATLGILYSGFKYMDVAMEGKYGTLGKSALINLNINKDKKEQSYISFETGSYDSTEQFQKVSFAKKYLLDENTEIKLSKDYSYFNEKLLNGNVLDSEIKINELWSIGISYEKASVSTDKYPKSISRQASTFRYSMLDPDAIKLFGKIEWREDENNETNTTIRHIYLEDKIRYKKDKNLNFILKGALGYAKNTKTDSNYVDFSELTTGIAYNSDNDKLNLLGKYSFISDKPLQTKVSFPEMTKSRKHIFAVESVYDLRENLSFNNKFAYRIMNEKVGNRNWQDSETYLIIAGLEWEFVKSWALFSEYRILRNETFDDQKQGILMDIRKNFSDTVTLCVGYNFTDFDDDLSNSDEYDNHGFFIRLIGRY